jgi:hypothetical protein
MFVTFGGRLFRVSYPSLYSFYPLGAFETMSFSSVARSLMNSSRRVFFMVQGGSPQQTIGDQSGRERRRMAGEAVPEVGVGMRSRHLGRWLTAMVVGLGFTAFAPACLAQVPVASNPTPVSFGSQTVGSAQAQTTVTFSVTTGGALDTTPLVLTTGAPNLDYTLGTGSTCTGTVSTGTCTVNVVFTPKAPGQRLGAVVLTSGGATVATALLHGTGTGAAVVFEIVTKLSSGDLVGVKDANARANHLPTWECAYYRRAISGVLQCFCQFDCAQHVRDAL